ncbi:MAG: class I SAM-dependent rRNA methyltransferase [Candidatus Korobacteraceae bacterium]
MKAPVTSSMITISRRAAARLRQGHVWVYRSDLLPVEGEVAPGSLVSVADERGNLVGTAIYSSGSQIALRMISHGPVRSEEFPGLVRERILAALEYRRQRGLTDAANSNAYRLLFSEADFLPGVIVDKYNDVLSVQILAQAMDMEPVRDAIVGTLSGQVQAEGIVERVDERVRELEQMPERESGLLRGEKTVTQFALNGVRFHYDALSGQKTGAFLDQRENYAAAEKYAHGDALDAFCYQGGFALHLARTCSTVTAVDSSRPALEVAERNENLNAVEGRPAIEWMEANAFDLLKDYSSAGRQYDTVVLDPPAFAKSKRDLATALRGYKELNLRALKMLRPGGVLVTCSCSFHVSEADFLEMLRAAAADVRRSPRLLEKRAQALDHAILLTVPETAYLKCLIVQV